MPKVNANECYTVECPKCYATLLVRESVRKGDKSQCTRCKTKLVIDEIVGEYRSGDETRTFEVQDVD